MKLVSMKTSPSEEMEGMSSMPPVGAPLELHALARVISVSEEQVEGKAKRCVELQVTDLGLPDPPRRPMADRLYGPRED
jgi:hypothetical protein